MLNVEELGVGSGNIVQESPEWAGPGKSAMESMYYVIPARNILFSLDAWF